MTIRNTQIPNKKIPNKNIVGNEFVGRPAIDTGEPSDGERQFQREAQPYSQRQFKVNPDHGYNPSFKQIAKEIFAGGTVKDDGTPFFRVKFNETLDEDTRERELVVCDKNGNEIFKITDKGKVIINGQDVEERLTAIETRLNNAGI